jgi:serine/threonine-protein kinase RsbW
MAEDNVILEEVKGYDNVVRLHLNGPIKDAQRLLQTLQSGFENCFKNGNMRVIVDFAGIEYPAASLIALLVEVTSRARRVNGDVKIINLTRSARNNFATFSPISYLSLEADEHYALRDFGPSPDPGDSGDEREKITPEGAAGSVTMNKNAFSSVDIVEDPLIERLENAVDDAQAKAGRGKPEAVSSKDLRVASEAKNLYAICDFVTDSATDAGFSMKEVGKIKIAVYEACLNVIEHAYHSNPNNWIDVRVAYDPARLLVDIKDYGFGFEGFSNTQYDVMSAMDDRKTGGFGLYIIRRSMDEIEYVPDEQHGNLLRMIKFIPNMRNGS